MGDISLSHAPAPTEDTKGGCKIRIVLHPQSPASVVHSVLQSVWWKSSLHISHCQSLLTAFLHPQLFRHYKNKLILWAQGNNANGKCKSIGPSSQCGTILSRLSVPSASWPKPVLSPRHFLCTKETVFKLWNESLDIWLYSSFVAEERGCGTKHYPVQFVWL